MQKLHVDGVDEVHLLLHLLLSDNCSYDLAVLVARLVSVGQQQLLQRGCAFAVQNRDEIDSGVENMRQKFLENRFFFVNQNILLTPTCLGGY